MKALSKTEKEFRFPEGIMTQKEWVHRYADRVEEGKEPWSSFFNRTKFNRMGNGEQDIYMAQLKKKAEKTVYRAWRGDTYQMISKVTYDWALERFIK